jgi:hypothetical protein
VAGPQGTGKASPVSLEHDLPRRAEWGGLTMTSTRLRGLLLAVAFGGCALTNVTRYEPAGSDGGYSELQLGPDLFRVAFQGNPYTSQERVADMALLRAADLALAHGASYFVVVQQLRESRSFPTPPFTPFPYTSYGYG